MSAPTPRLLAIALLAVAAGVAASPAHAQQSDSEERFTLRLSAFNPEAQLRFTGDGVATNGTETEDFFAAETFDVGSEWRPRGAIGFRLSERQALVGNYYDYRGDETWEYGGNVLDSGTIIPGGDAIEIPSARIDGRLSFSLASLNYEYAVVKNETFEWGLGLGVTYAELEVFANGSSTGTDLVDPQFENVRWKRDGFSPGLHTRLSWIPADRWTVSLEAQYLDTRWGDFLDERGHFERAGLVVEYMVNERVGVHVGYDWFRLKLKDDYTARFEGASELDIDPVDVNGELSGQLKVHGPMAGVTFRF